MDEILQQYEVRKSNKEKERFIVYLKKRLGNFGYEVNIEQNGKGILKSRNIVVGDLKEASVVFSAHYDTCAVLPFPNFMTPVNTKLFVVIQTVLMLFIFLITLGATIVVALLTNNAVSPAAVFLIFLYGLLFQMLFGYRNKHAANDNTSGVITITKILENLSEEDRRKVCVVYFDNEEKGLLGSGFFSKKHKEEMKNKLLINFDCVGDGKTVAALAKEEMQKDELYLNFLQAMDSASKEYEGEFISARMKTLMFGSDQMYFKKGVGVCALRKSAFGMYVGRIHTPFDTVCRKENLEYITKGAVRFVEMLAL